MSNAGKFLYFTTPYPNLPLVIRPHGDGKGATIHRVTEHGPQAALNGTDKRWSDWFTENGHRVCRGRAVKLLRHLDLPPALLREAEEKIIAEMTR